LFLSYVADLSCEESIFDHDPTAHVLGGNAANANGHFVRLKFFQVQMFGHFVHVRALQYDGLVSKTDRKSTKTGNGMTIATLRIPGLIAFALHHQVKLHGPGKKKSYYREETTSCLIG
jgi:hypothetical protein|tara:strand:+ start:277 stop:630 length:354 start_codon:yes stop_codon:yes gene_type:complete